ncbi:MAG TPA: VOC family protein [Rhizomicrobium sp.]|nr:VOC family protein [Rhizomicrobium sp.]
MADFRVERLDHVHVYVKDRDRAVRWYEDVLGLSKQYEDTDHGDGRGPVVMSSDGGRTHLALIQSNDAGPHLRVIAFRVDAKGFKAFAARLGSLDLRGLKGERITAADVVDHGDTWSIYFCDPDGNPYEVTTYDHAGFAASR